MKKIFNPIVRKMVRTRAGRSFAGSLQRFSEWFRFERSIFEHETAEAGLKKQFSDLTVRAGYFQGLKYPGFASFGSSLFPKLSGSYESELFPFFKAIKDKKYASIIDIGCAEGFYAAGLALKYPAATVEAFDIDEGARKSCAAIVAFNGVADRVNISGECSPEYLQKLDPEQRRLIICDCEGFERHLFNQENTPALIKADLVIELHPMFATDVKKYLQDLFKNSHQINIVSSYDDNRKLFDLPEVYKNLPASERLKLVQEGRSFSMDWLTAVSKY